MLTPRAAAGALGMGLTLFLLATTQPWAVAVVEAAAGAPRARAAVTGAVAAPWAAPAALLALAAALLALARRSTWLLVVVTGACAAVCAGPVTVVLDPGAVAGPGVVSARPAGWAWVALAAAAASLVAAAAWWLAAPTPSVDRRPRRAGRAEPAHEAQRREAASQWRSLDDGEDPTGPS